MYNSIRERNFPYLFQNVVLGNLKSFTKYDVYYHLLFGIAECYNYLLYVSLFTNKRYIGFLVIIKHWHLYLVKTYIDSNKIQHCVTPNHK